MDRNDSHLMFPFSTTEKVQILRKIINEAGPVIPKLMNNLIGILMNARNLEKSVEVLDSRTEI